MICFVTGHIGMDNTFIEALESHGIIAATGKFPKNVVVNALLQLKQKGILEIPCNSNRTCTK